MKAHHANNKTSNKLNKYLQKVKTRIFFVGHNLLKSNYVATFVFAVNYIISWMQMIYFIFEFDVLFIILIGII